MDGESVKSVSEEIGYTPSSIYGWYRRYHKKGIFPSMKKSDKHTVTPHAANAENIDDLKAQMREMQMEIDILKETINVLKKRPRRRSDSSQEPREGSDNRRPEK